MNIRVQEYVDGVLTGRVVVGDLVRLAVERHVRDLENGHERGLVFDETRARIVLAFFSLLKHYKGVWAGMPITLEPWQQFILWVLFGWYVVTNDGGRRRRFRTALVEVARKNGKTTIAAGTGLFMLTADGEAGAEIYSVATKRDQARICHGDATQMVKSSAQLRKTIKVFKNNLHVVETASKFEPLSSDYNTLDGLNIHFAIGDELHAWPDRALWDVIETATGARRQPLLLAISTAGSDTQGLLWQLHEYTEKVLHGVIEDDTFFGMVFSLDAGDDWENEAVWVKANPNLGISKYWDDMRTKAARAKEMPAALNAFLRLELNVWTRGETKWMNMDAWKACGQAVDVNGLAGRTGYAALDLSSVSDITALVLVFPPEMEGDLFMIIPFFFVPEGAIDERAHKDRVPYPAWVRQGYLIATPGNLVDYEFILATLERQMELYDIRALAFDRWGSQKITTDLQNRLGFTVDPKTHELSGDPLLIQFGQGFASMSPPMKELERLVLGHQLAHGNHPVLTWMADNVVARLDPAGNIKPDKEKSREKIDGITALIMALARALLHTGEDESVYEERGIRTV